MASMRSRRRGYTVVELMMALTVFTIGVTGIISMQKVTVVANQHAKNLSIATNIAQSWIDQLTADATVWTAPSPSVPTSNIANTRWLDLVTDNASLWIRPPHDLPRNFGPGFDALGNVVNADGTAVSSARFCTHIRLSWLYPDTPVAASGVQATRGNGLIRAEVRVFWLRDGESNVVANRELCDSSVTPAQIGGAFDRYHFVYHTSAVRQNTGS